MQNLTDLIATAQDAIRAIASHPDFWKALGEGGWDDAEIGLSDMDNALNDLYKAAIKEQSNV